MFLEEEEEEEVDSDNFVGSRVDRAGVMPGGAGGGGGGGVGGRSWMSGRLRPSKKTLPSFGQVRERGGMEGAGGVPLHLRAVVDLRGNYSLL